MILENHVDVPAAPDAVFALINDVERVAGCLPGAVLEGQDEDAYLGRVKFKVGPIGAEYAGRIRFTEIVPEQRRLRLSARGADSHGNGDAEADVTLTVVEAPNGSALDLHTDLNVRGKIAQFGKGAIGTVSNRLLDQFARNLSAQLAEQPIDPAAADGSTAASDTSATTATAGASGVAGAAAAGPVAAHSAPAASPVVPAASGASAGNDSLDGLAMLLPPQTGRYAAMAALAATAMLQGWLLGRVRSQERLLHHLLRESR